MQLPFLLFILYQLKKSWKCMNIVSYIQHICCHLAYTYTEITQACFLSLDTPVLHGLRSLIWKSLGPQGEWAHRWGISHPINCCWWGWHHLSQEGCPCIPAGPAMSTPLERREQLIGIDNVLLIPVGCSYWFMTIFRIRAIHLHKRRQAGWERTSAFRQTRNITLSLELPELRATAVFSVASVAHRVTDIRVGFYCLEWW